VPDGSRFSGEPARLLPRPPFDAVPGDYFTGMRWLVLARLDRATLPVGGVSQPENTATDTGHGVAMFCLVIACGAYGLGLAYRTVLGSATQMRKLDRWKLVS
jgi:hypothetical protein